MKNLLVLFLLIFMVFGCSEDSDNFKQNETSATLETRAKLPKVDICHYDAETGEYHTITVNENALEAHLAHGDALYRCVPECVEACCWCEHLEGANLDAACWTVLFPGEPSLERLVIYFTGQLGSRCCGVAIWENGLCETELLTEDIGAEQAAICKEFLLDFIATSNIPECDFGVDLIESKNEFTFF